MYEYLRQFIGKRGSPNDFYPVNSDEILASERRLGYTLPLQLRSFYEEIGYGFLCLGQSDSNVDRSLVNRVAHPQDVADLLLDRNNPWRPREGFTPGLMPFFDCGDYTYLVMKPLSEEPNAVFWPSGLESQRIADSLEEFFYRLYEHADFYRRDFRERNPELFE